MIDPEATYTPESLASAAGCSSRHVYGLCREGLLRHRRSRPGGRGRIAIEGAWWLDYLRSCEVAPEPKRGRPSAIADAPTPTPRRRRRAVAAIDPLEAMRAAAASL